MSIKYFMMVSYIILLYKLVNGPDWKVFIKQQFVLHVLHHYKCSLTYFVLNLSEEAYFEIRFVYVHNALNLMGHDLQFRLRSLIYHNYVLYLRSPLQLIQKINMGHVSFKYYEVLNDFKNLLKWCFNALACEIFCFKINYFVNGLGYWNRYRFRFLFWS